MKSFKYNIYIIMFIITGMLSTSCEDFLTVKPENNQSADDFWKTKGDVEAVLGAGYVKIRAAQESFFLWGEARGNGIEFYVDGSDLAKGARKLRTMETLPTNVITSWAKLYEIINMANSVLKYGPTVVDKDMSFNENSMKSFAAEAYFQRSLAYFYLVRLWKDVPYITDPYTTDDQDFMIPKSDGKEILEKCLVDLNASLEYAKEKFEESSIESSMNTKGRATRWALYSLIADINLWLGNYDESLIACDKVMNSGYVGLIDGSLWFSNFYPGNSNESIYEIQYSKKLSQTNDFIKWFNTDNNFGMSISSYYLFYNSGTSDLRGSGASYYGVGSSSVLFPIWKYIGINSTTARSSSEQNDQNWIVYRLADIYLMMAECYIMKGSDSDLIKGAEYINAIRSRAGITLPVSGSNQLQMLVYLLNERQREFVAEGKNWFDMLRVGRRDLAGCKELFIEQVLSEIGSANASAIRAKLADTNSWYLPINSDELKNNSSLIQNPYYENLGN